MKSNLQYIFDKITTPRPDVSPSWKDVTREPLMERITAIGLSDRGADIGALAAAQVADAVMAGSQADRELLLRIRQSLAAAHKP